MGPDMREMRVGREGTEVSHSSSKDRHCKAQGSLLQCRHGNCACRAYGARAVLLCRWGCSAGTSETCPCLQPMAESFGTQAQPQRPCKPLTAEAAAATRDRAMQGQRHKLRAGEVLRPAAGVEESPSAPDGGGRGGGEGGRKEMLSSHSMAAPGLKMGRAGGAGAAGDCRAGARALGIDGSS